MKGKDGKKSDDDESDGSAVVAGKNRSKKNGKQKKDVTLDPRNLREHKKAVKVSKYVPSNEATKIQKLDNDEEFAYLEILVPSYVNGVLQEKSRTNWTRSVLRRTGGP